MDTVSTSKDHRRDPSVESSCKAESMQKMRSVMDAGAKKVGSFD
jgi:hypothetical protein